MADSHSTPDTDQSGTERSVIVGYRPNVFDKSTPKIILSGKWLRAAGFDTGQQITVKVMNGCIVLMVYGEQEQRLQDELKEVAYKALPADLVDKIKVDVAGMKIGDTLRVKDLEIAKNKNIHITTDPEAVVATVTPVHNVVPETETEAEETAEEK